MAADAIQKSLFPKLFHVPFVAPLLHNCAMKVVSYFEDVDELIAKVKSATGTNKTRQAKFSTTDRSLQPVVAKWRSWFNGA